MSDVYTGTTPYSNYSGYPTDSSYSGYDYEYGFHDESSSLANSKEKKYVKSSDDIMSLAKAYA